MTDAGDDPLIIGRRGRQIRQARGKSLRVIAGLAGIGASHLDRIETGQRALDSLSDIVALASALQVAPSELTRLPVPASGNGQTDAAIEAVRLALMAASHGLPAGQVLPAEALRARVAATIDALCRCERDRDVGLVSQKVNGQIELDPHVPGVAGAECCHPRQYHSFSR